MKESKLMKEVVQRSVQPDLDMISHRILTEHEKEKPTTPAIVRSHYFSAAVACVGLVFIAGLVMGLLIMRSAMKPDLQPNTAPEIIYPNGKEQDHSSLDSSPYIDPENTDPDEHVYIEFRGVKYESYNSVSNEYVTRRNLRMFPITEEYMKFLGDQRFIGFINNNDNSEMHYLSSNAFENGTLIFQDASGVETFYAYTPKGIYKIGPYPSAIEITDRSGRDISEPVNDHQYGEQATFFHYQGMIFIYNADGWGQEFYNSQEDLFVYAYKEAQELLADTVFLGTIIKDDNSGEVGVTGSTLNIGAAVFYNKEKNMMINISQNEQTKYLVVNTYSSTEN